MKFFCTLTHPPNRLSPSILPVGRQVVSICAPMDLSSLEGPPLPDPQEEEFLPPYPPELRALELSPPSPSSRHLIPSPLQPRRTETETAEDPISPLQERRSQRNHTEGNLKEGNYLRRALAKRGRRGPGDQLQLHIIPTEEQQPQPQHECPEPPPRHAPNPFRPDRRRLKSSHRLVWREEEQQWIVLAPLPEIQSDGRVSQASSSASRFQSFSRSPVSPMTPQSPQFPQQPQDRRISDNRVHGEMPPPYESHRFGPATHTTSRWAAVTRRIPGLSVG
ncbi:hypothetical protein N7510_001978 [Penicillium lagena]|uniref:uncharacterized protein n=1 Tax=Penicillium lagena TaxID=94218 RepID=UPI0025405CE5|nr:uncharacterized protein N7510_001978 [Penicillium lagena]KAJ5625669.1 hypothetical protein N7510_001978 [Penicillium lagena]